MRFALTKWYLDLVTDDGVAVIGYSARLRWGPFRTDYAAVLVSPPAGPPSHASTVRPTASPRLDPETGSLEWAAAGLGLVGRWRGEVAPLAATLLPGIEWRSPLPRATAEVWHDGHRYRGSGYVDRLELTIPPHRLPFRRLRWGRHLSPGHQAIWIGWADGLERHWAWLDGVLQPVASVSGTGVAFDDTSELRWASGREVIDRGVAESLRPVRLLLRLPLLRMVGAMRERKRLAASTLRAGDGRVLDRGHTIHEEVTW